MRHNTKYEIRDTKPACRQARYAFTIVEILIVIAVLGILAAVVIPTVQGQIQQARESAAKDNLRILRNAIGLYAAQHNDVPPGYPDDDPTRPANGFAFFLQIVQTASYLSKMPENPFNGLSRMRVLGDEEALPTEATGEYGWVYKPATKDIRIDWPGTDSQGVSYYDY